jgi:hypothetical protein
MCRNPGTGVEPTLLRFLGELRQIRELSASQRCQQPRTAENSHC